MSESVLRYATRTSVALALTAVITAGTLVHAAVTEAASFISGGMLDGGRSGGAGATGPSLRPETPAAPRDVAVRGVARVIDGDTIEISGVRIRLEGIDAPETGQLCARRFFLGTWKCGLAAARGLAELVEARETACESRGTDKYGRMIGICHADGIDINERMVRDGLAWAFVKYSTTYAGVEQEARAARRGIFATSNIPAWEFRAKHWAGAEQAAPAGCAIKGNSTRHGQIYHMPWSPWYKRVAIDTARGDRWFCSESEAIAAGWRPAQGS